MTAGDGASEQARLAGERVVRLRSQLEQAERVQRAWTAGAVGEELVAERLRELEAGGSWLVLHDVHWPGRPKANLDHVAVGPGGVLVIDAKNWTGDVGLRHGELFQNRYSRRRETESALEQSSAVAALLEPRHRDLVQAWLCMVGQPDLSSRTSTGVRVEGLNSFVRTIAALPSVLDDDTVKVIHRYLRDVLAGDSSHPLLTTAGLDSSIDAAALTLRARRSGARVGPSAVQRMTAAGAGLPAVGRNSRSRVGAGSRQAGCSRRRKQSRSCLGTLLRLGMVILALSFLLTGMKQLGAPVPLPSEPVPAVSETLPPD